MSVKLERLNNAFVEKIKGMFSSKEKLICDYWKK